MSARKSDTVSFKVDPRTRELLEQLPNRSEFIRHAVLQALVNLCPVCQGTGILTPSQREHWDRFSQHHALATCHECHEVHLICRNEELPCLSED